MNIYILSDKRIQIELGEFIKSVRLRGNVTQKALSKRTALSLNTIKALESGQGKIPNLITVLRELGRLDLLNFISEPRISPIQLAKMQGKSRQRASGKRKRDNPSTKTPTMKEKNNG